MSEHRHGYAADKDALIKRLHRIEGQVRGIERMVEDDRYCIDILTQIAAVNTALESLAFKILDDHVNHCVAGALASGTTPRRPRRRAGAPRGRAPLRPRALTPLGREPKPERDDARARRNRPYGLSERNAACRRDLGAPAAGQRIADRQRGVLSRCADHDGRYDDEGQEGVGHEEVSLRAAR